MQGGAREIAVEVVRADGSRLPALMNASLMRDADGAPRGVRTIVFDATDRRRYEQELMRARRWEQGIAQQLQDSLLAGVLPSTQRLQVEVAYRPAVAGLDVGGDWYDAFWVEPDTTVALVVGDVVGRGIGAAATMGQLRSAVRAISAAGRGPAGLIEALDHYCNRHDVGRMTTLVYAELDLGTRSLRYACAGHPPPAIVPSEGPAACLWDGRSAPLDVGIVERKEGTAVLEPGSAVVLYSDGLIEHRGQDLTDGIDALLAALGAGRDEPLAGLLGELAATLPDAEHPDDVCLVGARLSASDPPAP
jgi:serine/threonine-protein kinase RsbW